jgi:WD40 repeat protein
LIDLNLDNDKDPEVLAELNIMNPIGIYYYPKTEELLVGTSFAIYAVKRGGVVRRLDNNFFNSIHSIKSSPRGIYVVCTSVDTIVEIDPENPSENLWEWIAPENGLDTSPKGEHVVIDRENNYQKSGAIGSSHHATHVNGVQHVDDNHVLATLFHQDQLVLINKETGKYEVVFEDLVNPHGIHKIKKGYLVSDTRGNRAIRLDNTYKVVDIIEGDFDWVQDAIEMEEYVVVANDNMGKIEVFNANNENVKQFVWDSDKRMISGLYSINAINALKVFSNE